MKVALATVDVYHKIGGGQEEYERHLSKGLKQYGVDVNKYHLTTKKRRSNGDEIDTGVATYSLISEYETCKSLLENNDVVIFVCLGLVGEMNGKTPEHKIEQRNKLIQELSIPIAVVAHTTKDVLYFSRLLFDHVLLNHIKCFIFPRKKALLYCREKYPFIPYSTNIVLPITFDDIITEETVRDHILMLGRISFWKGQLSAVTRSLLKSSLDMGKQIHVYGRSESRRAEFFFKQMVAGYPNTILYGAFDAELKRSIYAAHLCNTQFTTFPSDGGIEYVTLEAMKYGCIPLISENFRSTEVEDSKNCLYVDKDNIGNVLKRVFADNNLCKNIRMNNIQYLKEKHSLEAVIPKYLNLLEKITKGEVLNAEQQTTTGYFSNLLD